MATTKTKVTEQVPGLQQAPLDGKFVVRKAKDAPKDENGVPNYTRELFLIVGDEDEYSVPVYGTDDQSLISGTYQLTQQRKEKLRVKLFDTNEEVELTA